MKKQRGGDVTYDRRLLLGGAKRSAVLELWETRRYGTDNFGDADFVSIYGMRPGEWYQRGIRLLGRTAVECTRDELADAMGRDIAVAASAEPRNADALVIDPFVGSGNTLYWLLRHLPGARGLGFELDASVFALTQENLSILGLPIEILHTDYESGLAGVSGSTDQLVIAFLAPPWGDAFSKAAGLDLRHTEPPICEIVDVLTERFANRLLCAIQVYEKIDPDSLTEVEARFDWSTLRVYDFNAPGENHGILLAGQGRIP
jgi:hypothetical protein